MKLVTFVGERGDARLGALFADDQRIVDLAGARALGGAQPAPAFASMLDLIEAGPEGLALAAETLAWAERRGPDGACLDRASTTLLAPLPRPTQIRDFLCFELHLKQAIQNLYDTQASRTPDPEATKKKLREEGRYALPDVWYEHPVYYKANRMSVIGTDHDVRWPRYSRLIDYELEFATVIGRAGRDILRENALDHVFGYTIFNDFSARDAQGREMPGQLGPAKGKDFDTGNAMGPCIVTADEVDPARLTMVARVNGEEWSRGSSETMYHRVEDCIVHASRSETLYPGEVFGSGTVGNGCGLELGRFLKPGDVVELEISGIGVLRNRITTEDA
ncbi:MAG: fumarylacetoacetate hydrolase family protein [Labilithrix sp.]|nr:fumarylacetoacetate hydrolase family protein [Labilithrix sp.]